MRRGRGGGFAGRGTRRGAYGAITGFRRAVRPTVGVCRVRAVQDNGSGIWERRGLGRGRAAAGKGAAVTVKGNQLNSTSK